MSRPRRPRCTSQGENGHTGNSALAFDAATRLAVAGQDEIVRVWRTSLRGKPRAIWRVTKTMHGSGVWPGRQRSVGFGRRGPASVAMAPAATGPVEPVVLAGHTDPVTCLAVASTALW